MSPAIAAGPFPELDDPSPDNNTSSASLAVNPQADVSLAKTVSNPNPGTDNEVVYTLTASNAGPNDATGVTITDSLPAGLDFLDASPGCENNNGTVTCDVGTIASGGNASVTIAVLTTAAVAGASVTNERPFSPTSPTQTRATTRRPYRSTSSRWSTSANEGCFESVGERGWLGQLHADLDQQRAEPRNWGHDHRSTCKPVDVRRGEPEPGQLQLLRGRRSPVSSASSPWVARLWSRSPPTLPLGRRRERAEHRDGDSKRTDRRPQLCARPGLDHARRTVAARSRLTSRS